ncbi:MAG: hypothetical protein PHR35_06930 [Kiritimatiellae bacterium]|nr:hypothetical protein [Kiritimatiellia bacterium]
MNLQVNLLRVEERRRPGGLVARTLIRASAVVGGAGVLLYAVYCGLAYEQASRELHGVEARWRQLEPDFKRAEELIGRHKALSRQIGEIAAFSNAQIKVALRLRALAEIVPAHVQLTSLDWNQKHVNVQGEPMRQYLVNISGRTGGARADQTVRDFIAAIRGLPPAADFGTITPGGFSLASLDSKAEAESLFEVRAEFAPRRLK